MTSICNETQPRVQLSEFMMTGGSIHYNLDAVKPIVDMRVLRHPQLLAGLARYRGVVAMNNGVPKLCGLLAYDGSDVRRKIEVLDRFTSVPEPGGEPATLAVIVARCQIQLGPDEQNLLVQANHPTVVESVLVVHGHPDVAYYVVGQFWLIEDVLENLPGVFHSVELEEVIFATVATHL